ncbi:MAG: PD-(D/E)XK nuclease family protein [Gemmatimonadaceae bacterium]|nr:PD-(D/E)XK nuclease family protein [Gemmatimonadaceae bacterium]
MAQLRVVVGRDPERLLRAAADGFLTPRAATADDAFPTVPCLLALRQGGLRDDVIAMAAAARVKGWFDPPLCIFHELPARLGAPERRTLGAHERLVLLSQIVREHGSAVFDRLDRRDDFVEHVDRLFGELISEGVTADAFRAALEARPDRDGFEAERDEDLGRIYAGYLATLASLKKADGRDAWIHCARAIESGSAELAKALGGRREIRIFGLQDLRRGWLHLIRALAGSSAIDQLTLYTSVRLPLGDLAAEWEMMEDRADSPAAVLFALERPPALLGTASLVIAPDIDREMDGVALEIRALVRAGAPPHRIAVVAREARPNLDRALEALARVGVPATSRRRVKLTSIPVVRAVASLFAAAADGWTRRALVELASQPYLGSGLDAEVLNAIGFRQLVAGLDAWSAALAQLETRAERLELEDDPESRGRPLPPLSRVRVTREAFVRFAKDARALDDQRTLIEWLQWLRSFLEDDPWKIEARAHVLLDDRFEILRLDLAGWAALTEIVREWHEAVSEHARDDRALDVAHFNAQLLELLTGDVPQWTPVSRGVQVLESLSAAYRSFDHVFLTGMEAGAFPKPAPRSPILDESDRDALAALGIPLERRAVWEERERELFRVLVAGASKGLTLSYSRLDDAGREVIASAFVEELGDVSVVTTRLISPAQVILTGIPLYRTLDGPARAIHAATIERERMDRVPSRYNGRIESPDLLEWLATEFGDDRLWSPSQLEDFAKCPWAYFSKRLLRIEKLEEPDGDVDPATRGSLLHEALKRFYDGARTRVGGPVFLAAKDRAWAMELATESVAAVVSAYAVRGRLGHASLLDAKRSEFTRIVLGYLAWEIDLHEEMFIPNARKKAPYMIRTGVEAHELRFDDMVYERDGVRIRYRGSIDRVELSVDDRVGEAQFIVAADYKTTVGSTPGGGKASAWADGVVLQIPLYALALSRLHPDAHLARAGYLALKTPRPVLQLDLVNIDKRSSEAAPVPNGDDKWQQALDFAVAHVKRARNGEFPAAPPGKCTCPPWCHGRDICRIPGGPVSSR